MFDGRFRGGVDKRTSPIGSTLARLGITANSLTVSGVLLSFIAGFAIVSGHFLWAFVAVVLAGLPDLLDGPVAKATNSSSSRGAFFDSFSDRISDLVLFGGLGWYYLDHNRHLLSLLSFGIYGAASLISYQRAKAESLGFQAKGGLLERAERVLLLAAGLLFSFALPYVVGFIFVGSVVTAGQRFVKIWRQGTLALEPSERPVLRRTHIDRQRRVRRSTSQQRRSTERIRSRFSAAGSGRPRGSSPQGLIRKFREGPTS